MNQGFCIISDSMQYQGAIALWRNFPSVKGSTVWIYDIHNDTIIAKYNSKMHDNHVWSDDNDKANVRLVFTKD
jgi:hypothetical protein